MSYRYLAINSESDSDQPTHEGRIVAAHLNRQSMTDSSLPYARFQNENGEGVPAGHMIEPFQMSDVRPEGGNTAQVDIVVTRATASRGQVYPRDSTFDYDMGGVPSLPKPTLDDPSRRQTLNRGTSHTAHESIFGGDLRDDSHLVPEAEHRAARPWNFTLVLNTILQLIDPCEALHRLVGALCNCVRRDKVYHARVLAVGADSQGAAFVGDQRPPPGTRPSRFPPNHIKNHKYNVFTFLPLTLFEQFRYFLNFMFLVMALTQFVPVLAVGLWYTYWFPLGVVVTVSLLRELVDDVRRWRRDREMNTQQYRRLNKLSKKWELVESSNLKVGDIVQLRKDERIPADMVLLRARSGGSTGSNATAPESKTADLGESGAFDDSGELRRQQAEGACFLRTDQLDGETDWKLRTPLPLTQKLAFDAELATFDAWLQIEAPSKQIYEFTGAAHLSDRSGQLELNQEHRSFPLSIENTLWSGTVLAAGVAVGIVVYTGTETRIVMNTNAPRIKSGIVDLEVNNVVKLLFITTCLLSTALTIARGPDYVWAIYWWRYFLLFSYIIPVALRVNLDMAKILNSLLIQKDKEIPNTIVRCTTIPEELGRIRYLLTDKTGTLTQNEMQFRRLHMGTVSFGGGDAMDEVRAKITEYLEQVEGNEAANQSQKLVAFSRLDEPAAGGQLRVRHSLEARLMEAVRAIALCHNVTPVYEQPSTPGSAFSGNSGRQPDQSLSYSTGLTVGQSPSPDNLTAPAMHVAGTVDQGYQREGSAPGALADDQNTITYQASSPDEVALVKWARDVGLRLVHRDQHSMNLLLPNGRLASYEVLQIFPFTSESKRMGIIVRSRDTAEHVFYMKGADNVMATIVRPVDWLAEEVENMAREGLRTLVVARKTLTPDAYQAFAAALHEAKLVMGAEQRAQQVKQVLSTLERDMDAICITGVEDLLQDQVQRSLENFLSAGIKVWMLTGDKLETAVNVAKSAGLVKRSQPVYVFAQVKEPNETRDELNNYRRAQDAALIILGESVQICVQNYATEFMQLTLAAPAVVVCRCSPTQKADIVQLVKIHSGGARVAAIGDGGNDVSMIQSADCGIGVEGKEGRQASLAADFSIAQFHHLRRLLFVHGRKAYKGSAVLAQFVIHRGILITTMQVIYSALFYFAAVGIFPSILLVGYATIFTMFPVFSLVLDEDVSPALAMRFPELYKWLTRGREFSYKQFFLWSTISIFQGSVLMFGALLLFENEVYHIVAIAFTAVIFTELVMVLVVMKTWHWMTLAAELLSIACYLIAMLIFPDYFDHAYITSLLFIAKVSLLTLLSCIPLVLITFVVDRLWPSYGKKLEHVN